MRRLLNSPLHLPPSLAVLSTIFSKWAENEWEERRRGSELERDGKRIDINSDRAELSRAWRRYLSLSLKVWGRGNGLMVTSRDGEGGGGWRANAYILWPLGSVPPLSWQGWVERPLKAWGSSSDLTTISPSTKLVGVCLDKWTWQPPTMRSPCRLTTPQAYHLVQPRVYVCRDFSISICLLQVFSCLRMSPLSQREQALSSDDSAVSDARARRGRVFYRFLTNPKTKRSYLCLL